MHIHRWLIAAAVAAWTSACSDSSFVDPNGDPAPDSPDMEFPLPEPDPSSRFACEAVGFACTPGEANPQVLERSDNLLDELASRVTTGGSNEAAGVWLEGQAGVREVSVSASGIMFLLDGGLPMSLFTPPGWDTGPASASARPPPKPPLVVGYETPRADPAYRKRALVLAPFLFAVSSLEPSPRIIEMLSEARDYQHADGIDYIGNLSAPEPSDEFASGAPTVADFRGWGAYDVITIVSHGMTGCTTVAGETSCVTSIATGELVWSCADALRLRYSNVRGVGCARASDGEERVITVTSDFFADEYPAGLDRAVVVINTCDSSTNASLSSTLAGSNSDYFGWAGGVSPFEVQATGVRLFELLAIEGLSTAAAMAQLGSEGLVQGEDATLHRASTGGDGLRVREIVTLKNPIGAGEASDAQDLEDGDVLPFLGQAADGENDALFVVVEIKGVEVGTEDDYEVDILVNGVIVGTWDLTGDHAHRIDEYTVQIRVRQALFFDIQPGHTVEMKATVRLPSGGESYHEAVPLPANPVLHFRSTIETTSEGFRATSTAEAEIHLAFRAGDGPEQIEIDESEGVQKYLDFEVVMDLPPECSLVPATFDGRLAVTGSGEPFWDLSTGEFGLPRELVLIVYPEIRETLSILCEGFGQTLPMIHWFAGFVSIHGGQLGGPNEFDESRGGFVIRGWEAGDGEVIARRVYQRSGQADGTTLTEDTAIELRATSGGPDLIQ